MSQHVTVIEDIPFSIEEPRLLGALHMDETSPFLDEVRGFAREAEALARPKGMYTLAVVEPRDEESVLLDGRVFTSRVLRVNLEGAHRAFPFVATCGVELDAWGRGIDDMVKRWWADVIMEMALRRAMEALGKHLVATYQPGKRAMMNPGSLEDWPITQQQPLFALLGNVRETIGVELTESCLMSPIKSISGIWFETEQDFQNCQLCPRPNCPNRRAPYIPHLLDTKYAP